MQIEFEHLEHDPSDGLYYYEGQPFTGVLVRPLAPNFIQSEVHYVNGLPDGLTQVWRRPGCLAEESHFRCGVYHGTRTLWNDRGSLIAQEQYERGVCVVRQRWDDNGVLLEDFRISENDPQYKWLTLFQEIDQLRASQEHQNSHAGPGLCNDDDT